MYHKFCDIDSKSVNQYCAENTGLVKNTRSIIANMYRIKMELVDFVISSKRLGYATYEEKKIIMPSPLVKNI